MNAFIAKTSHAWNLFLFACFTLLFFGEVIWLSTHIDGVMAAPLLFWILAGFATLRLAHTLSYNNIASWIREPFCKVVPDSAGGSDSIEPKEGKFNVIGQLLACPICSGTWSAMFLITVYALAPKVGWAFVAILSLAGISECLHWLTQPLEWGGRFFREMAGSEWLWKNKGVVKPVGYVPEPEHELEKLNGSNSHLRS